MSVPLLTALDAVAEAIQDAVTDGDISIPSLRVVKTMRPLRVLEHLDPGWAVLVYPVSVESESPTAVWDEYHVTIAHELTTECDAIEGDEHTQERIVAEKLQEITDAVRSRLAVSSQLMGRPTAGLLDEGSREELNVISAVMAHTFRIQHPIS